MIFFVIVMIFSCHCHFFSHNEDGLGVGILSRFCIFDLNWGSTLRVLDFSFLIGSVILK